MRLPVHWAGVPCTVIVKVSQFTPSTQVTSPVAETPPAAVPSHASGGELVDIAPEVGFAAPLLKTAMLHATAAASSATASDQRVREVFILSIRVVLRLRLQNVRPAPCRRPWL